MLKDIELQELFGIPRQTLQDFKNKSEDNWRYKVYNYLKIQNRDTVMNTFDVLNIDTALEDKSLSSKK